MEVEILFIETVKILYPVKLTNRGQPKSVRVS